MEPIEPFPGLGLTDEHRDILDIEERFVPGPPGEPEVRVLLYRPRSSAGTLPLVVNMHGGAFRMRADHFPAIDAALAGLGAQVVSVDYRSVPDALFPAAPEDCYATLCWAVAELDVDADRVVVTGASAGGALAAAVCLMARDRSGPAISLQVLRIPVLDDRCDTASMGQFEEAPVFGARQAREMWDAYLGPDVDRSVTSPYAAPARAASLAGLPPAFIAVAALDPLRDEGLDYGRRLLEAGIPVEMHCLPGQHHGYSEDPRTWALSEQLQRDAVSAAIA